MNESELTFFFVLRWLVWARCRWYRDGWESSKNPQADGLEDSLDLDIGRAAAKLVRQAMESGHGKHLLHKNIWEKGRLPGKKLMEALLRFL